ncbi:Putative BZIP transcription factor JlbA/IDI-4 [Penicillium brasilianum]|uniref:Putative BZIP transcription factor JlbA/IDI-4 n=1 Tax=Penicillium brasilianum TaxID=104259 RepID=A0A0F7TNG9_PENBI|nr:Putative BZIP transcription factor JlbA/IDI-4 [Penicillium brasilianum]
MSASTHHQIQDYSLSSLAPPLECIPSVSPYTQSFDTFTTQESDLWAEPHLSIANTDWNFDPLEPPPALYTSGFDGVHVTVNDEAYGVPSTFDSLSDSGCNEPRPLPPSLIPSPSNTQDGYAHASPISQIPGSVSTSQSSPATSQGDDVLTRVDSSRVEKRRLNTLAAQRCRQRRVDRMKSLEAELESVRRERDELRLKVSKLEGETEALKGLLTRKSK